MGRKLAALTTLTTLSGLLLAAGLSGCGSSDSTQSASGSPASRSTTSAPAVAATGSQSGEALFASMSKAMADARSATVRFSSEVGDQQITGRGGFRFAAKNFAADMAVTVPGQGAVRVILLPTVFYLRLPTTAGLPAGKPWLKISTGSAANNPLGSAFAPLMGQLQESFDPESNLGLLKATTAVEKAGTEQVGGVRTTKYTATVDLAKAAEVAKGPLAQQYRTLVTSGVTTLHYSIWVDAKNLPRKFATVVPTSQGDVTASGTYANWGKRLSITAPPARLVASSPAIPTG